MRRLYFKVLITVLFFTVFSFLITIFRMTMSIQSIQSWMEYTVNAGNNYSTKRTQDIDSVKNIILKDSQSRKEYEKWLDCMQNLDQLEIDIKGNCKQVGKDNEDETLTKDIIPYLKKDLKEERFGYTPLNFGITFLDRRTLEKDMKEYIVKTILINEKTANLCTWSGYRIDPNTIDVKVSLKAIPCNINKLLTKDESRVAYTQIFGLEPPKDAEELSSNRFLSKSKMNTIVRYEINYHVYFDIIPDEAYFIVPSRIAKKFSSEKIPPDYIYFPRWYDENVSSKTKISYARLKFMPEKYLEFKYNYILTH